MEHIGQLPPQELEAETALLGALIMEGEVFSKISDMLKPDDFYKEIHRLIYSACSSLHKKSEPLDIATIKRELDRAGSLDRIGGLSYLSTLTDSFVTVANIEHHARMIKEASLKRQLIKTCRNVLEDINSLTLDEALQKLSQSTATLTAGYGGISSMKEVAKITMDYVERRYKNKNAVSGVSSGLKNIDEITDGFQPCDLIILAARPGVGKSALAMNIAYNAKVPVGVMSLEMGENQIGIRQLADMSSTEIWKLRKGFIGQHDWPRLMGAITDMSQAPIYPVFTARNITEIDRAVTELIERHNIQLLIVDYLQFVNPRERGRSRQEEVAETSRYLKNVATLRHIPVIALAQLNRLVDQRADKKPTLSDLKESGQIEQDADVVMFLCRDPKEKKGPAEVVFAKGRNIGLGVAQLQWDGDYQRFEDSERRYDDA